MIAYKTYLTVEDPKQIILSDVPFQPGQRVEVVLLAAEKDHHHIQELKSLFKTTQSLSRAQNISEEEIVREIEIYRKGK
ncbi:MAG TPA: hypothetical protein ENI73_01225 [Spirochaetes bacterium]|nr:hypothetical protein [Spirochaetota bacterium]